MQCIASQQSKPSAAIKEFFLQARMSAVARLTACPRLTLAACRVVRSTATRQTALLSTSSARTDIDSAAKFIGAGAATVGVAGSGAGIGSGKLRRPVLYQNRK